jgi:Na+/melibiose symporter-like transporter
MLGGDEGAARPDRRPGAKLAALLGVLLASVLPLLAGFALTSLVLGRWPWLRAAWAQRPAAACRAAWSTGAGTPVAHPAFRALLAVFVLNGVASAVPATLVLFFVQDRLQAPPPWSPVPRRLLPVRRAAIPAWLALVPRLGLAATWLAGMLLACWPSQRPPSLQPGDARRLPAGVRAVRRGARHGPGAARRAARRRDRARRPPRAAEGAYFGWWNCAGKLNLALAAGLALPLLALAGYVPGSRAPDALQALMLAYCVLPCLLNSRRGLAVALPDPHRKTP